MSAQIEQRVTDHLDALSAEYSVMDCDPELADTAAFCEAYGVAPEDSANAILVASKRPPGQFSLSLVLAPTRLDVNRRVRDLMGGYDFKDLVLELDQLPESPST